VLSRGEEFGRLGFDAGGLGRLVEIAARLQFGREFSGLSVRSDRERRCLHERCRALVFFTSSSFGT
jgi:hypothetical protein